MKCTQPKILFCIGNDRIPIQNWYQSVSDAVIHSISASSGHNPIQTDRSALIQNIASLRAVNAEPVVQKNIT